MIVIDKTVELSRIVVTISENVSDSSQGYNLSLHSPYDLHTYTISLPENTSAYQNRYDEFLLDTSIFNDMNEGQYYYTIKQVSDGKILETGLLEIIGTAEDEVIISLEEDETEDDFIVYQGD